ncbi:COG4223 family protein [Kordiimonas sp.]|uniref:COG4223 family protein n=1 Tax=Kordiimonas sp. TaxID=1970157 RepID=UPI003A924282
MVTEPKNTSSDQETPEAREPETGKSEPEFIDAEVIAEHEPPNPAAKPKKAGMSWGAKAGWLTALGLSTFMAGVYVAPTFDPGLTYLGLRHEPPPPPVNAADTAGLQQGMEALTDGLKRHQEILAQHEAALQAADDARAQLRADISAAAASSTSAETPTMAPEEIASLQADIARLQGDITRLSDISTTDDPKVEELSGALALARAESTHLKNRLQALEGAMKAVEAGALEANPRGRLVLSLGRLKDRAIAGQAFGSGLDALKSDFAALPALDQQRIGADLVTLERLGAGIAPYTQLVSDFDAMAAAALKATEKADGNFLTKLFTVRRTDAGATGLDAALLKAERALAARNIKGAVEILEGLEGPALGASEPWRHAAKAHIETLTAFDNLIAGVADVGPMRGEGVAVPNAEGNGA